MPATRVECFVREIRSTRWQKRLRRERAINATAARAMDEKRRYFLHSRERIKAPGIGLPAPAHEGEQPMPFCRRDRDDAPAFIKPEDRAAPAAEWREPPGRLGDYVRRVKRLPATQPIPSMPSK